MREVRSGDIGTASRSRSCSRSARERDVAWLLCRASRAAVGEGRTSADLALRGSLAPESSTCIGALDVADAFTSAGGPRAKSSALGVRLHAERAALAAYIGDGDRGRDCSAGGDCSCSFEAPCTTPAIRAMERATSYPSCERQNRGGLPVWYTYPLLMSVFMLFQAV